MRNRSASGRRPARYKRARVFVTPALHNSSPGGVYTASGRPVGLPTYSVSAMPGAEELDDWVPEPEEYQPDIQDEGLAESPVELPSEDLVEDETSQELEAPVGGWSDEQAASPGSQVSSPVSPPQKLRPEEFVGESPQASIPVKTAQSTMVRWRAR